MNDPTGHKPCDEEKGCGRILSKLKRTPPPNGGGSGGKNKDDRHDDDIIIPPEPPIYGPPEPSILSDGRYVNPELEAIVAFWDYIVSPFADGLDMHEAYVLASSKWYKTAVWTLPTGYIEAGVAGYRQYYRDSWWESYNPVQRTLRIGIVASETLAIDRASSAAGTVAGLTGGSVAGPWGAAGSYGVTAYGTTKAGNDLATKFNRWVFPTFGLGLY